MPSRHAHATRLVPLEVGRVGMELDDLTGEPGTFAMPVPVWLIEHPAGTIVFDTGLHRDLQTGTGRMTGVLRYNPDDFDIGHEVQQIDGEHDVFGDGSVVCVPTPDQFHSLPASGLT